MWIEFLKYMFADFVDQAIKFIDYRYVCVFFLMIFL
jgi:hypothetical protein